MTTIFQDEEQFAAGYTSLEPQYGGKAQLFAATTTISGMSGATVSASNFIPAGALVLGLTLRVITLITMGAGTTFTIGDGTTADLWGTGIALALGTTTSGANFKTTFAPKVYQSATSVVLTGTGGSFTAGAVRLTLHYWLHSAAVA